jgi:hypothetical protein
MLLARIRVISCRSIYFDFFHLNQTSARSVQGQKEKNSPVAGNVVDLMEALRRSICGAPAQEKTAKKSGKKPRKASSGQKEMLMPIAGKKQAKETSAKTTSKPQRKSA